MGYENGSSAELSRALELTQGATQHTREAREHVESAERYAAEGRPEFVAGILMAANSTLSHTVTETAAAADAARAAR